MWLIKKIEVSTANRKNRKRYQTLIKKIKLVDFNNIIFVIKSLPK